MHSSVVRNTPRGNSSGHHTPYDNRNTPLKTTTLPTATDPFASSFSSFINEAGAGLHGRTHACAVSLEECAWWLLRILYVSCRFYAYPETVGHASNDGGTPQGTSPWRLRDHDGSAAV